MSPTRQVFTGGRIFNGKHLRSDLDAVVEDGVLTDLIPTGTPLTDHAVTALNGDILSLGYVDLQVNGGGGVLLNDDPSVTTLKTMAAAHRALGATRILPTLITDTPTVTTAALDAAATAIRERVPGILGLHLEGPHISLARKGAHDARFIRHMTDADLAKLVQAKAQLPVLMVTLAPENVTPEQVSQLANAGIHVSLGHSDADFDTCLRYADAGAHLVTHLFNAMSQLGSRTPGLVGAALSCGGLHAGLIADGVHVHPAAMRAAFAAKTDPGEIFLVSDAMAVSGTDLTEFTLGGRTILRRNNELRLEDGTLAGADLDLTRAISVLVHDVGIDLATALAAATTRPAKISGLSHSGLTPGQTRSRDIIRISSDLKSATPLA